MEYNPPLKSQEIDENGLSELQVNSFCISTWFCYPIGTGLDSEFHAVDSRFYTLSSYSI